MYYLRFFVICHTVLPVLGLLGWFALLLYSAISDGHTVLPAVSVLLVCLGFLSVALHIFTVRWNNFRFKLINYILVPLSLVLLTAY